MTSPLADSLGFTRRGRPLARPLDLMYSLQFASIAARPEWLEALLDVPTGEARRWVQIHHGNLFELSPLATHPIAGHRVDDAKRDFLRDVIRRCHARDVRVAWMIGKLSPPAGLLEQHPDLANLHSGAYWRLIETIVVDIFAALPDLDEFSVYLFESPPFLDAHHFFGGFHHGPDRQAHPYLAPADLLRELLHAFARGCRRAGKSFSLLTHVWYPFQEQLLAAALRDWPDDLPLVLEHNYSTGDFNPHLPENALLRDMPHLRHGLLFCGGLEYNGLGEIPFCHPEMMQERIVSALDHTPRLERISFRPVWDGRCLLGTPNEVNLAAAIALAHNPTVDLDAVWRDWARQHGSSAPEQLASALREVSAAVLEVFFQAGTRTNDHSRLPAFDYLVSRATNYGKALLEWCPTPENRQAMWELLVSPTAATLRRNAELHAAAEEKIRRATAHPPPSALGDLRMSDGSTLAEAATTLTAWIRLHRWQMEAFLLTRRPENFPDHAAALSHARSAFARELTAWRQSGQPSALIPDQPAEFFVPPAPNR